MENRRKQGIIYGDFLGGMMEIQNISDEDICSAMVGVIYASYANTTVLIQWIIKYLHDYPTVRDAIQVAKICSVLLKYLSVCLSLCIRTTSALTHRFPTSLNFEPHKGQHDINLQAWWEF